MRVLHVHSGNLYGGVETMLATLAATRGAAEHRFALCFDGRFAGEIRDGGHPLEMMGPLRFRHPWTLRRARRRLARLLDRDRPTALMVHSTWGHAAFAPVAVARDVPVVYWVHAPYSGPMWLRWLANRQPPTLVICNSRYTCAARGTLFSNSEVGLLHYPVAAPESIVTSDDRARLRRELDTPDDAVVIVQVARFEPWKGQTLLLDALGLLRGDRRWTCWVVGGAQRSSERRYARGLERRARRLGIADRVRFAGERRDVTRILSAADLFCHPNVEPEPFGIAFIEAMYAGLPIVGTAMGGPLEIVNDTCGMLVEPNEEDVCAALERLIDDAALRHRLGDAAPGRARDLCDPQLQSRRLTAVLRSAILGT